MKRSSRKALSGWPVVHGQASRQRNSPQLAAQCPESSPGTYALILALRCPFELQVGRLGRIRFDSPYYIYCGSAFGPGGLHSRIRHHLQPALRVHWHIDYLRQAGKVVRVWYCRDSARLECTWADAALMLPGASQVPRFGSSDCRCRSHLVAIARAPRLSAFGRRLEAVRPGHARIEQLRVRDFVPCI